MSRPPRSLTGSFGSGLLLLTLLLAGALAIEAVRGALSHRAAADRVLREYAQLAAWEYARESRNWLNGMMSRALLAMTREIGPARGPLPGPEMVRRVLARSNCECISAEFARNSFRILAGADSTVLVDGEPLSPATVASLRKVAGLDTVTFATENGQVRVRLRTWRVLPPGLPDLRRPSDIALVWWFFRMEPGAGETLAAVYGMVVDVAQLQHAFRAALEQKQPLPPVMDQITDASVVHITVRDPSQSVVFQSGPDVVSRYLGTDTLGAMYGELAVSAALLPDQVSRLISVVPFSSRVRQIVVLLVLTLGVGLGALLLLRRERQLALLREDFVSGVSHELRTPLTQIRMLSELLAQKGFHHEDEEARATRVIHREALRLTNLVENVLRFNPGERRQRHLRAPARGPARLREVIDEVAEGFEPLLAGRGDRLTVDFGADFTIITDRDAVARILRNLLENAMKYGPAGQHLRVALEAGDQQARIVVEDEGPGIPPEEREAIWRPYHRLTRDQNRAVGGSGLGLAVVADLAASLNGRCWVESASGGGARFVVELPLGEVDRGDTA